VFTHCNGIASPHRGKLLEHSFFMLLCLLTICRAMKLAICSMMKGLALLHRHLSKFVSPFELTLEKKVVEHFFAKRTIPITFTCK